MARHKRGRLLDQSTRDHLKSLDDLIKSQAEHLKPKQQDEFTMSEYIERLQQHGTTIGDRTALQQLVKLVESGKLSRRKITFKGHKTNVYRVI